MPSPLSRRLHGRAVPALLVASALVVSAGVGGATAGALITGADIADKSITSRDIAGNTLGTGKFSAEAIQSLRTRWIAGSGVPSAERGDKGTWHLDTSTGDAYKKTASGWEFRVNIMGATGAPGAVGPQGTSGLRGEGGAKGDTGEAGAKGDTGEAGSSWLRGADAPSATTGRVGDWYLDSESYDAYQKSANGWVVVVNLRGPVGPKGDTGAAGEQGDTGAQGLSGPVGDRGETGPPGPAGQQGVAGPKGDQGDAGTPGAVGATGEQGVAGAKGDQGAQGDQGLEGPQGPQGPGSSPVRVSVVVKSAQVAAGNQAMIDISCAAGQYVIGYDHQNGFQVDMPYFIANFTDGYLTGYTFQALNGGSTQNSANIRLYCGRI